MIADSPQTQLLEKEKREISERGFVRILAIVSAVIAGLPDVFGWLLRQPGSTYLGIQYNLDDHMVYAAWMRQAMDGRFLFDNRFTTDQQPGLTVHLYFLVLGWIAKLFGIALTMALVRIALSAAFVFLLYRLVRRICPDVYTTKLAMSLVVVGGGIGALMWRDFGQAINPPIIPLIHNIMLGLLPTDVWQPEGYVMPSMLTNGLFMASLCLIVISFLAFLSAKDNWRWVPQGALAMFLLMNIHSYDVLIIAFAMVGLLVAALVQKQFTIGWLARSLAIGVGAVPSALWFLYVLQRDAVFQARAATPTYAANFRQVAFGYLGLMILGLIALAARPNTEKRERILRISGTAVASALLIALFATASSQPGTTYFLEMGDWMGCAAVALVAIALVSDANPAWNLAASWALLGTIAPYFPALFQRKLSMGLAIPWAILAALAVGAITKRLDRGTRNLALVLAICALGATSIRWFGREAELAKLDVSNTTNHPVYLGIDATQIVKQLNEQRKNRTIVIAMPGTALPDAQNPAMFLSPYMPDLNPILSGLAGVYTYAGHWSETPDYLQRRSAETAFFLKGVWTDDQRKAFLQITQADYIVAPVPQTFPALNLEDVSNLGEIVYRGQQFQLVRVR
jgi:hypothetical protein